MNRDRRPLSRPRSIAFRRHALVGTWELVSCEHRLSGGKIIRPFGAKPKGRLVYTPDGFMIVMIMNPNRPRVASGQMFEEQDTELSDAARGFVAYSGRCEVGGGVAVHHVDLSLFPNWIGSRQFRTYRLNGDRVSFSTRPFTVHGVRQTARLVWKRASK